MKLTPDNNPVINRKRRLKVLDKRLKKISPLSSKGMIEHEDGRLIRFYPNFGKKHKQAKRIERTIRKERKRIINWLTEHNYNLK